MSKHTTLVLIFLMIATIDSFPTESSVLRQSTAQAAAPSVLHPTSPHPFQEQIGKPSSEVDRQVTPVPKKSHRF